MNLSWAPQLSWSNRRGPSALPLHFQIVAVTKSWRWSDCLWYKREVRLQVAMDVDRSESHHHKSPGMVLGDSQPGPTLHTRSQSIDNGLHQCQHKEIRQLGSWEQARDFLLAWGGLLDAYTLVALCVRLRRFAYGRKEPRGSREARILVWAQLTYRLERCQKDMVPNQWSQVVYTCAKTGHRSGKLLDLALACTEGCLDQLDEQGLTNMVWSLGKLGYCPSSSWLHEYVHVSGTRIKEMRQVLLVQILWAVGRLQLRPDPVWLESLLAEIAPVLGTLSRTEVYNVLWSLGCIGYKPNRDWLRAFLVTTAQKLQSSPPHIITNTVCSLCTLRIRPPKTWWVPFQLAVVFHLQHFNCRQLSLIIWAMARLRVLSRHGWVSCVLKAFLRSVHEAEPRDLAGLTWGLSLLLHPHQEEYTRSHGHLLRRLTLALTTAMPQFSPIQLIQLMEGLAGLKYYPGVAFMKAHEAASVRCIGDMSEENQSKLKRAYQKVWSA